ncbi:MAG: sucrase ferredoxin, partial [Streptomyces sp.]|nr:sucrase ferredoxin [Streptomyces sp.]
ALTVLRTEGAAPAWNVTVEHADGRRWRVGVVQLASAPPRPESCGSVLGSPARMDVIGVRAVRAGRPAPTVATAAAVTAATVTQPSLEEPPRRAATSASAAPV